MICTHCGGPLTSTRVSRPYAEVGLSNVTLMNVEVRLCRHCRGREVVLPCVEQLHDRIAHAIVLQPVALTPAAIRFLRTWLGLSCQDLAALIGVSRETAFRWERQDKWYPMRCSADRLLRMLVASRKAVTVDPVDFLRVPPESEARPIALCAPTWELVGYGPALGGAAPAGRKNRART